MLNFKIIYDPGSSILLNQFSTLWVFCHLFTPVVYLISRQIFAIFSCPILPNLFFARNITLHLGRLIKSSFWSFSVKEHSVVSYFCIQFSKFNSFAIFFDVMFTFSTSLKVDFWYVSSTLFFLNIFYVFESHV